MCVHEPELQADLFRLKSGTLFFLLFLQKSAFHRSALLSKFAILLALVSISTMAKLFTERQISSEKRQFDIWRVCLRAFFFSFYSEERKSAAIRRYNFKFCFCFSFDGDFRQCWHSCHWSLCFLFVFFQHFHAVVGLFSLLFLSEAILILLPLLLQ